MESGQWREAERLSRNAADVGYPTAMVNLAQTLLNRGEVIEAEDWLHKACAKKDRHAFHFLSICNAFGLLGQEPDLKRALDITNEGLKWNSDEPRLLAHKCALMLLKNCECILQNASSCPQMLTDDELEALRTAKRAALKGKPSALALTLPLLATKGHLEDAQMWSTRGAQLGCPRCALFSAFLHWLEDTILNNQQWTGPVYVNFLKRVISATFARKGTWFR